MSNTSEMSSRNSSNMGLPNNVTQSVLDGNATTTSISVTTGIAFNLTLDMISAEKLPIYIPAIIYTALLMILGIPGNIIVCYVYYKKWGHSSTRVFILALACLDLINCFVTLPMEIAILALPLKFTYAISCKISRFTTYLCNTSAAIVLIAIAVDRFQRICRPLEKNMTSKTAKIIVFATVLAAVLTTWPALVIYGIQTIKIPTASKILVGHICLFEDTFVTTRYPLIYFSFNCVCTFINFIILCVLYSFVGVQVCRRWRFRSKSVVSLADSTAYEDDKLYTKAHATVSVNEATDDCSAKKSRRPKNDRLPPGAVKLVLLSAANKLIKKKKSVSNDKVLRLGKTTLTLFVVTLVYVVSFMPFLGIAIHRSVHPTDWINLSRAGEMAYNVFLRSYMLNSAVNPLVYSFCNDLFRKACISLFRNICRKRT